ncbi:MAG: 50S ribosomal protein L20 [Actinobacteria bacterium]|nr:50S ribosomal protein L20 [Actinomycetota bacterium]
MPRTKHSVATRRRRKKVMKIARGYRGAKSRSYKSANEQVMHSLQYAYRDRRARKSDFRKLWISRINAAARERGMPYNKFMSGLRNAGVEIDRKVLADLAVHDPEAFGQLVDVAAGKPAKKPASKPQAKAANPGPAKKTAGSKSKASEKTSGVSKDTADVDSSNE